MRKLIDWGVMPVYMGCVESSPSLDHFHRMVWGLNDLGQLAVLDPPSLDLVYPEQHSEPTVSDLWMSHHNEFADFILSRNSSPQVLEIGAAHGLLGDMVSKRTSHDVDWTILEPNPQVPDRVELTVIKGWFPADIPRELNTVSTIVASHVLEHAVNPLEFIRDSAHHLAMGGDLFLSWPDMQQMAERTDLNMLNFEHLHFLPNDDVTDMCSAFGLAGVDVQMFRGHSIFLHAKKVGPPSGKWKSERPEAGLESLASNYHNEVLTTAARFNDAIASWPGETWLFGAHIFSQFLIAAGLHVHAVAGVLDNAHGKEGKRLYGTSLTSSLPARLIHADNVQILMAAALYEQEIIHQLSEMNLTNARVVSSRNGEIPL